MAQKWVKIGFGVIFPIFWLIFSYFPGEAETYFFPIFFLFRAGGPKWGLYQANGIAIPNTQKRVKKDSKMSVRGLFRHLFDTPGREAREDLLRVFGDFGAFRVWRLLRMAVPIASLLGKLHRGIYLSNVML